VRLNTYLNKNSKKYRSWGLSDAGRTVQDPQMRGFAYHIRRAPYRDAAGWTASETPAKWEVLVAEVSSQLQRSGDVLVPSLTRSWCFSRPNYRHRGGGVCPEMCCFALVLPVVSSATARNAKHSFRRESARRRFVMASVCPRKKPTDQKLMQLDPNPIDLFDLLLRNGCSHIHHKQHIQCTNILKATY